MWDIFEILCEILCHYLFDNWGPFCEDIPYPIWAIPEIKSYAITYVIIGVHFENIFPILCEIFVKCYVKSHAITNVMTGVRFVKIFPILCEKFLKFYMKSYVITYVITGVFLWAIL